MCLCILGIVSSDSHLRSSRPALHRSTPVSKSWKLQVLTRFCRAPEAHSGSSPTLSKTEWFICYVSKQLKWSEVAQLCPTLCDPMECSLLGSSVNGIFQVRILEWVVIFFSRRSSWPRDWTQVSCIVGRRFTIWATGEVYKQTIMSSHFIYPNPVVIWWFPFKNILIEPDLLGKKRRKTVSRIIYSYFIIVLHYSTLSCECAMLNEMESEPCNLELGTPMWVKTFVKFRNTLQGMLCTGVGSGFVGLYLKLTQFGWRLECH